MNPTTVTVSPERREIVVTRRFNAPRELVFAAWTQPEHVVRWWGCHEMTLQVCDVDLRVGGAFRYVGRLNDGSECRFDGVYKEIAPPTHLVHTQTYAFNTQPATEAVVTLTFDDVDGATGLTNQIVFATDAAFQAAAELGVQYGTVESVDRLGEMIEGMRTADTAEFAITRTFDAPREMVFRAWSEPQRMARWWGPEGFTLNVASSSEIVPGGTFLYSLQAPKGYTMWGKFVYEAIDAPERIVFRNSFSNAEGETVRASFNADFPLEIRNTVTFTERDGKTELTLHGIPIDANEAERAFFQSMFDGMAKGFGGTFDHLADYLATQKEERISTMTTPSEPNDPVQTERARFAQAKGQLCRALDTTPDDRLNYRLAPTARTPLEIFAHAANAVQGMHGMLEGKSLPGATTAEADRRFREAEAKPWIRQEVLDLLEANADAYLAYLDTLTPERMNESITLPFSGETVSASLSTAITFATDHTIWHAAQINYIQTIYGDRDWH